MDDEKEAIRKYTAAIRVSKGEEKKTHQHILPEEKHHLSMLKKLVVNKIKKRRIKNAI